MPNTVAYTTAELGLCCLALMASATGCGRRNGLVDIRGNANYDARAVKDGIISFVPQDGLSPSAEAIISNGEYTARVAPGNKYVTIKEFKVVGRQHLGGGGMSGPTIDVREQILPECYNTKTELTCEITAGVCTYDFALVKPAAERP